MTYSCAVFSRGATTLEEAQRTKLDLIATKLELKPGQRLLDVGCGWGSFAMHAAREYGVTVTGITLSPSQAELARQRVADAGLADRVEIRIADYRELADEPFDAISAHRHGRARRRVTRSTPTPQALFRVLKPGGLVLNHAISLMRPEEDPTADKFTMRYVFPDGHPLLLSRTQLAFERARFYTEHVEGFMKDYADTLRCWHDNLDEHLEEAERLAGLERLRVWRLYLRAARHGFDVGYTAVYQLKARKPALARAGAPGVGACTDRPAAHAPRATPSTARHHSSASTRTDSFASPPPITTSRTIWPSTIASSAREEVPAGMSSGARPRCWSRRIRRAAALRRRMM